MDLNLAGRTALVTGASAGIGRATALLLAREGVKVAIVARRAESLEALAKEMLEKTSQKAIVIAADIMEPSAPATVVGKAIEGLGHVDILVSSAGGSRAVPIDASDAAWEEGMTLNFTRLRQITQALLPGMIERKWGRIINVSGKSEPDRMNVAWAAKAAIHGWAKALSREVGQYGITVNCVPPGKITTEQTLKNYSPEVRARVSKEDIPVGSFGEPDDVGNLIVYLASPLAKYITGAVIPVDGGLRRYAF